MPEKHSIVIEEYLMLLYQLRGAGERLRLPSQSVSRAVHRRYTLPCSACSEMI